MQRNEPQAESRAYKLFLRSINSPATLKSYQFGLDLFCKDAKLTYDEIIKAGYRGSPNQIRRLGHAIIRRGLRRTSILTHLNGVEKLPLQFFKKRIYA